MVRAGAVAGALSGLPSTVHALATGRDLLESTRAAGTLVLSRDTSPTSLLATGVLTHSALSLGWAAVLARVLPRQSSSVVRMLYAAGAGASMYVLDVGFVGRRLPAIRALPLWPQVADHIMYAEVVAWILERSEHP